MLGAVSASLAFSASTSINIQVKPSILILGDSMSDGALLDEKDPNRKGNNNWTMSEGREENPTIGAPITNWPNNTPLIWVNHMAEYTFKGRKEAPTIGGLYQCSNTACNYDVLNAAFASAETGNNYVNDLSSKPYAPTNNDCITYGDFRQQGIGSCVPGMLKQIELISNGSVNWPELTVYVWAGSNDLFNDIAKLITELNLDHQTVLNTAKKISEKSTYNLQKESPYTQLFKSLAGSQYQSLHFSDPLSNTKNVVHTLINDKGVLPKNIVVIGMPNLGQLPLDSKMKGYLSKVLSLLSSTYDTFLNIALADAIKKGVTLVHIQDWQNHQVRDSGWVQNTLQRTCVSDKKKEQCLDDQDNQKPYLFFNSKHPTNKAHESLWHEILNQLMTHHTQQVSANN